MIPSRGTCHGVFLLASSASWADFSSIATWVDDTRRLPTYLAGALDLWRIAQWLIDLGLVTIAGGRVVLGQELRSVLGDLTEDRLLMIARMLLQKSPPDWLSGAFDGEQVASEFIPLFESQQLAWMGDALEPLLVHVRNGLVEDLGFRKWLGDVGEAFVVQAERASGNVVRHVSLVSDTYGYDVESQGRETRRIEVKTSLSGRDNRFFLSKNEARVASRYQSDWYIVHVVLENRVRQSAVVSRADVVSVRVARSDAVVRVLPLDTAGARWTESAEVRTEALTWEAYTPAENVSDSWSVVGVSFEAPSS